MVRTYMYLHTYVCMSIVVLLDDMHTGQREFCKLDVLSFNLQCAAPFVGDGMVYGKDSDGDGYPDMELNCDDSNCVIVCTCMYICIINNFIHFSM